MLAAPLLTAALWMGITEVAIENFAFVPDSVVIQPGDTVRWTQKDGTSHTSTGTGTGIGQWSSGTLGQNQTYLRAFPAAGTYEYICDFHAMFGKVVVGAPTALRPGPAAKAALPALSAPGDRDARGRLVNPEAEAGSAPRFSPRP